MTKLLKIILVGTGVTTTATAATVGVVVVKSKSNHGYPVPEEIKYKVPKLATPPVVVFSKDALDAFEKAKDETATLLVKLGYAEYANNLRNMEVIPKELLDAEQINHVTANIQLWTEFFYNAKAQLLSDVQTKIIEDKLVFERIKGEMAEIIGDKARDLVIEGDQVKVFLDSVGSYNEQTTYSANMTMLYSKFISELLKLNATLAPQFEEIKNKWITSLKLDYTETSVVDDKEVNTLALNQDQLNMLSEVENQKFDASRSFDDNVKTLEELEESIQNQIDNYGYVDYDNE